MATTSTSLSSLLSRSSLDDHEQFLVASETALKTSASDSQAQHVKAIALLKLDRFHEALSFFEQVGSSLKEKAALEYAYALYKTGKLEEAAHVASKVSGNRGAQHIQAQARYRLENYTQTAQIYESLRNKPVPAEDFDLRVNQGAIDAQGQWLGMIDPAVVRRPDRDDLAAFETAYNAACGSIARGELSQAEVLLKRAKTLCQHSEELTDEQKTEELLPILVQQTYVLYRQGKTAEAEVIVDEIDLDAISDISTKKIASNNSLLNPSRSYNPFVAHKVFYNTPNIPESDKLFSYQSIPLLSNEKTIDLSSLKFDGVAKSTKEELAKTTLPSVSPVPLLSSAFNAISIAGSEAGNAAVRKLLPELQRRPNDVGLVLTVVQLHALAGNTTSAVEIVESFLKRLETSGGEKEQEVRYHPGLVSVVTALYKLQGRREQVRQELARAASYWMQRAQSPATLLRAAGTLLLTSSAPDDVQRANEIFDKLYKEQPGDRATIAGYVASHAFTDADAVRTLSDKLQPVSKLVSGIDVASLESAGIPQASNALAIAQAGSSRKRVVPSGAETGRRKRVRPSRLPKNFDPNTESKPDPERWLPMRDRSYYRPPKGKKKGKKGDDRTQGGAVSEDLDVSKQPQKGGDVVSGGGGGGGNKKKKAKGKK